MGYMEKNVDPIIQIEADIVKANQKLKDLQTEMQNIALDIHVLQLNLTTLKNTLKEK